MNNFRDSIKIFIDEINDYWDSAGILVGNIMGIYGIADIFFKWGLPYSKEILGIGVFLYIISGLFYMVKMSNAVRDKDRKISELELSLKNLESQFKDLQIAYANSANSKEAERLKQPEIIFPKRSKHFEDLTVKGSSPEQIMNYIRDSISTLWLTHMEIDKIAYDIDYSRTKFYDPQKDNTFLYGAIFDSIKYRLGKKENGTLSRTEIEKIHDMFSISIFSSGFGNEVKSNIRFDTNDEEAIVFYYRLKEELSKQFKIEENWVF